MRRFRRIELVEPHYSPLFVRETSIFAPSTLASPSFVEEEVNDLSFALDFFNPNPSPFEVFDSVTDLVQIDRTPSLNSYRRIQRRSSRELSLQTLCDRVSLLESRFDRLLKFDGGNRKYTWTAEIEDGSVDRKYKWTAEIEEGKKKKEKEKEEKNYKWTARVKGKGEESRTYTFEASTGNVGEGSKSDKKDGKKNKKKDKSETRVVEIEEPANDHGDVVLRQAFSKRAVSVRNNKGKQKELSPQDAAIMIQMTFRAYLIRRSQALRALRDLAVAKTKLKELRALFNNFSYRSQIARDAEERQRFSEKIIVLLLTVDAIEGADIMVRSAKKSMIDELEAMLDVVDSEPAGRSLSMRRRTFDMPDGVIRKEIAASVAQVVQMVDNDVKNTETFEACL